MKVETQRPWQSRTFWLNAIATVGSVLVAFGVDVGLDGEQQAALATMLVTVSNIVLRFKTHKAITLHEPPASDPMQGPMDDVNTTATNPPGDGQ